MTRFAFVLAALAALSACGQQQPPGYAPEYQLNFMRACQAQGAVVAVCSCTWSKIEREIEVEDFVALEQLPLAERVSNPLYGQIERYAVECRNETLEIPDEPPPP